MQKTISAERLENFVECVNAKKHIYYIYWGEMPVEDEYGTQWQYYMERLEYLPTLNMIKEVVWNGINKQTDERIASGFIWNDINVWLSSENQFNFKAAYDLAVQTEGQSLPVKFKIGETAEGEPVYHTFEDMEEFTDFYTKAIAFINTCLNEGWKRKDSIDWSQYIIPE